jgi:hypothetical protein
VVSGPVSRVTSNDPYHGKRFYTRAEAVDLIRPEFDSFRDYVRSMARGSFGHDELREALVEVIEHFNNLDDAVLARFGLPSPHAEVHPELGDEPPTEWPVVNGQSPANRNANDPAWRMDARPGVHRGSP